MVRNLRKIMASPSFTKNKVFELFCFVMFCFLSYCFID